MTGKTLLETQGRNFSIADFEMLTTIQELNAFRENIHARVSAWADNTSLTSASNTCLARQLVATDERAGDMLQMLLSRMAEATLLQGIANDSAERVRPEMFGNAEYEYVLALQLRRSRLAMQQPDNVRRRHYPPSVDILCATDRGRLYHSLNSVDRATVDSIMELLETRDQRIEEAMSILSELDASLGNFEEYVASLG